MDQGAHHLQPRQMTRSETFFGWKCFPDAVGTDFWNSKLKADHEYKYIVDGNEKGNGNAKIDESSQNNVIQVKKSDFEVFEALAMDLASNTKSSE